MGDCAIGVGATVKDNDLGADAILADAVREALEDARS